MVERISEKRRAALARPRYEDGSFKSPTRKELWIHFREYNKEVYEKLVADLKPENFSEHLLLEQIAGCVSVLQVCAMDMQRHNPVSKNGTIRASWDVYTRGLAIFKDLYAQIQKPTKLEKYLEKRD